MRESPFLFAAVVVAWVASEALGTLGVDVAPLMPAFAAVSLGSLAAFAAASLARHRLDADRLMLVVVAAGVVIRLCYVGVTPYDVRQHDSFPIDNPAGHQAYILWYARHVQPPDFEHLRLSQFYHPPLHYVACGLLVRLQETIGVPDATALEGLQHVGVLCSLVIVLAMVRVMRRFGLSGLPLVAGAALASLHPGLTIYSGFLSNDMPCAALAVCSFCALLGWYDSPSMRAAMSAALLCGAATLTKANGVISFVPAGVLCIMRMHRDGFSWREPLPGGLTRQINAFLLTGIAMALSVPVYRYIRFGMTLGDMPTLPTHLPLYFGHRTLAERFLLPDPLPSIYVDSTTPGMTDCNVPIGLFKSSLFDEQLLFAPGSVGYAVDTMLAAAALCVSVAAVAGIVRCMRMPGDHAPLCALLVLSASELVFFVFYAMKQPFTCTLSFRYVIPLLMPWCLGAASAARRSAIARWLVGAECVLSAAGTLLLL